MKTILIVEDEFAVLVVLALALEAEGFEVLKAGDGVRALELLATNRCHVVLCDAVMPFMDGPSLLARMRQSPELAKIPFLLMAHAYDRRADGADVVLGKPVNLAELMAALRALELL